MLPTTAPVCYGASTLADDGSISGLDPLPPVVTARFVAEKGDYYEIADDLPQSTSY
jgi:hypothetical protein